MALGVTLGATNSETSGSGEDIIPGFIGGEVLVSTLEIYDGVTIGLDDVSEMCFSYGLSDISNNSKPEG